MFCDPATPVQRRLSLIHLIHLTQVKTFPVCGRFWRRKFSKSHQNHPNGGYHEPRGMLTVDPTAVTVFVKYRRPVRRQRRASTGSNDVPPGTFQSHLRVAFFCPGPPGRARPLPICPPSSPTAPARAHHVHSGCGSTCSVWGSFGNSLGGIPPPGRTGRPARFR